METFAFPKNSHSSEKRHVAKNLDAVRWRRSRCCPVAIAFLTDNSVEDRRWLDPRRTSGCIARPRDTEDCQWLVQSSMFSAFGFRNRWICTLLDIRRKDVSLDDEIRKNPNGRCERSWWRLSRWILCEIDTRIARERIRRWTTWKNLDGRSSPGCYLAFLTQWLLRRLKLFQRGYIVR